MARTKESSYAPKNMKKTVRQEATSKGMEPKVAKQLAQKVVHGIKTAKNTGLVRRNPGRMDGVQWRGASFTCPDQVDDSHDDRFNDLYYDSYDEEDSDDQGTMTMQHPVTLDQLPEKREYTISLMDIAKPAKPRGIAKQFEIVDSVPRVIVLDDEPEEWGEDWEDVEPTTKPTTTQSSPRQTYSAVLASG